MLKHFSREQAAKILEIRLGRLRYWDRIELVKPSVRRGGGMFYDFQDLICLRTAKKIIEKGVAATHLARSIKSLMKRFPDGERQLSSLRVFALGDRVIAGRGHRLVDSLSDSTCSTLTGTRFGVKFKSGWTALQQRGERRSGTRKVSATILSDLLTSRPCMLFDRSSN